MSFWTHINGVITVSPMGRTQPEKEYILKTVLSHLPKVTGSERDMTIQILQKPGFDLSSTHDEFLQYSNLRDDRYGFSTQSEYFLVVNASLRDRTFIETYREFLKWLCRLAKRVDVESVLVRIDGWNKTAVINEYDCNNAFSKMNEDPSWINKDSENWCEYLMWDEEDL